MDKDIQRFNSYYKIINDCFIWQKYLDKDGYGTFYFKQKGRKAHRVAVYFSRGDIPNGTVIDHICKNRSCVNPKHLRMVTVRENVLENSNSVGAINKRKIVCKNGHPFDKVYGKKKRQRYCSICERTKTKNLRKKWLQEANKIMC